MSWCSYLEAKAIVARVQAVEGLPPAVAQDLRRLAWLVSGDTDSSSEAIFKHMTGAATRRLQGWEPSDYGDLGRCIRLLEAFPEWRARLPEMAAHGPLWATLVAAWADLERLQAGGWSSAIFRWMRAMRGPVWEWDGPEMWNPTCRHCGLLIEQSRHHDCPEEDCDE